MSQPTRFALFVGYPRSGHSLVGACLDAHPHAIIADEYGAVLRRLAATIVGEPRLAEPTKLLDGIRRNARVRAEAKRRAGGYDYQIDTPWVGKASPERLIGDKKGGATGFVAVTNRGNLQGLQSSLKMPMVMIHVIRNPWDNIATFAIKDRGGDLRRAIVQYFALHAAAHHECQVWDSVTLHLNDLIERPREELSRLAVGVGLDVNPLWLDACCRAVYKSPKRTWEQAAWTDELVELTRRQCALWPQLQRYEEGP